MNALLLVAAIHTPFHYVRSPGDPPELATNGNTLGWPDLFGAVATVAILGLLVWLALRQERQRVKLRGAAGSRERRSSSMRPSSH